MFVLKGLLILGGFLLDLIRLFFALFILAPTILLLYGCIPAWYLLKGVVLLVLLLSVSGLQWGIPILATLVIGGLLSLFTWNAGQLWAVFNAVARMMGIQVVRHEVQQLSDDPYDPGARRRSFPGLIVEFYATQAEFMAFMRAANKAGLWFYNIVSTPFKLTDRMVFSVRVRERYYQKGDSE